MTARQLHFFAQLTSCLLLPKCLFQENFLLTNLLSEWASGRSQHTKEHKENCSYSTIYDIQNSDLGFMEVVGTKKY